MWFRSPIRFRKSRRPLPALQPSPRQHAARLRVEALEDRFTTGSIPTTLSFPVFTSDQPPAAGSDGDQDMDRRAARRPRGGLAAVQALE
jgi:hypothetical protein